MKLNKKWLISLAGIVGLVMVGVLAVSVLATANETRDAGRETQPDTDETVLGALGAGPASAQQVEPTATVESGEGAEGSVIVPASAQQIEPTATAAAESGEGIETNEAGEGNEAVEADDDAEIGEGTEAAEAKDSPEADKGTEAAPAVTAGAVTPEQAKAIAVAAYPGTTAVGAVESETYKGIAVYSIDLSSGLDVFVDANTGKIVGTKQE